MSKIKLRLLKYLLTFSIVVMLALFMAHGPHGGAAVGLLMSVVIGLAAGAIFILLNFRWYWNALFGFIISMATAGLGIIIAGAIPERGNEIITNIVSALSVILIFVVLIEGLNYLGRRYAVKS